MDGNDPHLVADVHSVMELSVIEEIGVEHMQQLNENMALFAKLFSKAGGLNDNEANP